MARKTVSGKGSGKKASSGGNMSVTLVLAGFTAVVIVAIAAFAVLVGIDSTQGDSPEKVKEFVERYDIESPTVYEPSLGPEYRVPGYPTVYVLDRNNEVVGATSGEAPREVYEGWIEEALGGG
jgi:hypothetical protein